MCEWLENWGLCHERVALRTQCRCRKMAGKTRIPGSWTGVETAATKQLLHVKTMLLTAVFI